MTSWFVRFSISLISGIEKRARSRMVTASAFGIWPSSAIASQARISISSQISNLRLSDHRSRICGREYRSITAGG